MGKTKTAFVSETDKVVKTSAEKYAEKKAKREQEKVQEIVPEKIQEEKSPNEIAADLMGSREVVKPTSLGKKNVIEKQRGKKYLEAKAKISKSNNYKIAEAIKLVKETSYSKFDGTMEMHLVVKKTGVNINVTLPFSAGKEKRIEFADEKTLEKLKTGKIDFDVLLATADIMPKLVAFAKLLGPRGLMPNPKNGTIVKSIKDKEKLGGNTINLKTEKEAALIHTSFGKVSQKDEDLVKNAETILEKLGGSKTIIRAFIKSTMSPSIKLQLN